MICIKTEIPKEICEIDDELKAIYHSHDTVCIWVFKSREDRNNFMNDTVGMKKEEREKNIIQIIMYKYNLVMDTLLLLSKS
jgi:hypothetical protein